MTNSEFQQFTYLFDLAEKKLKQVETVARKLTIPPLNELRYAGCHIARHLAGETEDNNILAAERHCKRAIYDSMEIGISYFLDKIGIFTDDYKQIAITDVINSYIEDLQTLRETQAFIYSKNRHEQENSWDVVQEHYGRLEQIYNKFEAARPELNKKIDEWRDTLAKWLFYATLALGTLVATIIGVCMKC